MTTFLSILLALFILGGVVALAAALLAGYLQTLEDGEEDQGDFTTDYHNHGSE